MATQTCGKKGSSKSKLLDLGIFPVVVPGGGVCNSSLHSLIMAPK